MGMYHSTSGKTGYEPHTEPARVSFSREELKRIFAREDELRASAATQQQYTDALASFNPDGTFDPGGGCGPAEEASERRATAAMRIVLYKLETITKDVQKQAIREVLGRTTFNPGAATWQAPLGEPGQQMTMQQVFRMNEYLKALHNARWQMRDDPELNALTVYQRQDRSRRGSLRVGDAAPDVPLLRPTPTGAETEPASVLSMMRPQRPLVLVCGSVS